ncbi:MAG: galactokinase [Treponema sp.]|jgi:galactokinase|nr:galactokinase [Treponema sp.]
MNGNAWITALNSAQGDKIFTPLYGAGEIGQHRSRYIKLVEDLLDNTIFPEKTFPETHEAVRFFTAPGRTELGGNHTDHNCGKVLAASVQLDAVAATAPRKDNRILFRSTGFPDVSIDITDTSVHNEEKGTAQALIRGVAAGFAERCVPIRGWTANAGSTVLPGSGLSSSAALEVLAAKIFDGLYSGGAMTPIELAEIAQKAENHYYGKPSGLMDQAASASGGAVAIDFAGEPVVTRIEFDPAQAGYALCVVNTGGSHADLTPDYGAIPMEMRSVAGFFGSPNLRAAGQETLVQALAEDKQIRALRVYCGDRAILRAMHFFDENERVDAMHKVLEALNKANPHEISGVFDTFLELVNKSGASSWEFLQNIASPRSPKEQGLALALGLTRRFGLRAGGKIACRVHGGGFAGTIQAYIPYTHLDDYKLAMEAVFGFNAVTVLKIRSIGAAEITIS